MMMKRKGLAALLVLSLLASVLPLGAVPALAAALSGQVIYVGDENVTSGGYWTTDSDGSVTPTDEGTPTDNYIHYDAENNTLTLHNATIKESVSMDTSTLIPGAAIGVLNRSGDAELTITLEGTNTIAEVNMGIYVLAHSQSTGSSSLTITGDGSLDASGSQSGIQVQSNGGGATLEINSAEVKAVGGTYTGYSGVLVQAKNSSNVSLTVDGGNLTASGNTGINFWFGSSTSGSGTPTVTVSNNAIVRANGNAGGISDNSSTALEVGADSNGGGGIIFDNGTGTVYGDVTLQESLTIGEGESLTLDDGASLDTGDYTLKVDGGTLTGNVTGTVIYKVTSVSLNKDSLTLDVGGSETLTATITPDNATDQNVTWSSNNQNVATVENGKVTAVGAGSTTIKATVDGKSAECSVTVNAPATTITTQPSNVTVTEGETATFSVAATGSNLTYQWQQNTDGSAWANISGATSSSYTTQATTMDMDGSWYRCVVTGDGGTAESNAAILTVRAYEPPYIGRYSYEIFTDIGENGTIDVDRYATEGDDVTITITPDEAYLLDTLTVTSDGEDIELTDNGDGTYTFTMPSGNVDITATFAEDPDWEAPVTDVSELFIDIAPDAWYKDAVQYAYNNGLMTGTSATEFAPEATTTRAMIVSMLARLENVTDAENAGFTDVDDSDWYATAVNWAAREGIVNGVGADTFAPNDPITREQFAAMLMNYAQYKGMDTSARATLDRYSDVATISSWATDVMSWSVAEGLLSGVTNDTLEPQANATRAQVAAILERFLAASTSCMLLKKIMPTVYPGQVAFCAIDKGSGKRVE